MYQYLGVTKCATGVVFCMIALSPCPPRSVLVMVDMQPYAQLCVLDCSARGIAVSVVSALLFPLEVGPLILVAAALLNGLPDLCLYLHLKVWGFVYRDVHCRTRPDW